MVTLRPSSYLCFYLKTLKTSQSTKQRTPSLYEHQAPPNKSPLSYTVDANSLHPSAKRRSQVVRYTAPPPWKRPGWHPETRNLVPTGWVGMDGCGKTTSHTADGWRHLHMVNMPLFYRGFLTIQTVVVFGISAINGSYRILPDGFRTETKAGKGDHPSSSCMIVTL